MKKSHDSRRSFVRNLSALLIGGTAWLKPVKALAQFLIPFGLMKKSTGAPLTLWGWGGNPAGGLGLGDKVSRSSPVQVGTANWTAISCGREHSHAIKPDGTLWTAGFNDYGQLGMGDVTAPGPSNNRERSTFIQVGSLMTWSKVGNGHYSNCAVDTNGKLWSWGYNAWGNLALNDAAERSSPVQVGALTDWKSVECGPEAALALKTNGTIWSWGRYIAGVLGTGNMTVNMSSPVQIGTLTTWSAIAMGEHAFAVKTDGTLWAWGSNGAGRLGLGDATSRSSPVQLGALTNWKTVTVANESAMALKTDGTIWSWGRNHVGQLGFGDLIDRSSPVQIGTRTDWAKVKAGLGACAFGITTNGTLWAWGYNADGRLGLGDATDRSSPVQVGSATTWEDIDVGYAHVLALRK